MTQGNDNKDSPDAKPMQMGRLIHLKDVSHGHPSRFMFDIRKYWNKQRKGDTVPYRTDIQAAGLGPSVDYAFIAERIAPGTARYRLAGQHLHKVMGMEVRGLPLASVLRPAARQEFAAVLETVFKAPQIAEFWLTAYAEYSRPALTGRMLLLPLKSDLGDVARVFGCLTTDGELGQTPRRFDVERYELSPIIAGGRTAEPKAKINHRDMPSRRPPSEPTKISSIATSSPEQRRQSFTVISNEKRD